MSDLISRQAAIDALDEIESEIAEGLGFEYEKWREYYCDLPSAQPELPEWAQKVEEYRKIAPKTFSSPLAWALYQTWREYAERRTDDG